MQDDDGIIKGCLLLYKRRPLAVRKAIFYLDKGNLFGKHS